MKFLDTPRYYEEIVNGKANKIWICQLENNTDTIDVDFTMNNGEIFFEDVTTLENGVGTYDGFPSDLCELDVETFILTFLQLPTNENL